jgi:hypothetical protein
MAVTLLVSRAEGNGGKAGSYLPRRIEQQEFALSYPPSCRMLKTKERSSVK